MYVVVYAGALNVLRIWRRSQARGVAVQFMIEMLVIGA